MVKTIKEQTSSPEDLVLTFLKNKLMEASKKSPVKLINLEKVREAVVNQSTSDYHIAVYLSLKDVQIILAPTPNSYFNQKEIIPDDAILLFVQIRRLKTLEEFLEKLNNDDNLEKFVLDALSQYLLCKRENEFLQMFPDVDSNLDTIDRMEIAGIKKNAKMWTHFDDLDEDYYKLMLELLEIEYQNELYDFKEGYRGECSLWGVITSSRDYRGDFIKNNKDFLNKILDDYLEYLNNLVSSENYSDLSLGSRMINLSSGSASDVISSETFEELFLKFFFKKKSETEVFSDSSTSELIDIFGTCVQLKMFFESYCDFAQNKALSQAFEKFCSDVTSELLKRSDRDKKFSFEVENVDLSDKQIKPLSKTIYLIQDAIDSGVFRTANITLHYEPSFNESIFSNLDENLKNIDILLEDEKLKGIRFDSLKEYQEILIEYKTFLTSLGIPLDDNPYDTQNLDDELQDYRESSIY